MYVKFISLLLRRLTWKRYSIRDISCQKVSRSIRVQPIHYFQELNWSKNSYKRLFQLILIFLRFNHCLVLYDVTNFIYTVYMPYMITYVMHTVYMPFLFVATNIMHRNFTGRNLYRQKMRMIVISLQQQAYGAPLYACQQEFVCLEHS